LGEAALYISALKQRVERLREVRDSKSIVRVRGRRRSTLRMQAEPVLVPVPVIEVRSEDTNLEVILVSGLHNRFELHRVLSILDQEGADVKSANISVVGDKVFYTIHSQVSCIYTHTHTHTHTHTISKCIN
jgi:UTP:GlnB (protein PII) uridylyltransferase